jgi:crotonobetainyl-CoA:carnitine CoA-transferase CaiB-like acyl-CoA transferase
VISVENDEQWRALATALKGDELLRNDCFRSSSGRRQYHDDLDRIITAWTSDRDCYDVMAALTNVGVPAGVVQNGADLLSDKHLHQRGFLVHQDNPRVGPVTLPTFPLKFANCTLQPHWEFPELGRDTATVLHDLLGFNLEQIASMVRDGLLE